MSHKAGHVIIDGLVATDKFPPADCDELEAIAHKDEAPCSFWDALTVARIVYRRLRKP
jgi:hypothetical protein